MTDGFNWGLRPSGKSEPKPERSPAEPEDPFAFLKQLEPTDPEPTEPAPTQARRILPTRRNPTGASPTTPRAEVELPPTESMPTPENPYRPEPEPVEPPMRSFAFPVPDAAPARPIAETATEPPMVAQTAAQPTLPASTGTMAIDAIFGESAFREYDDAPLLAQIPRPTATPRVPRGPREPMGQAQRVLLGVALGLVAVLVLVLVFVLGTRLPGLIPDRASVPSAAATTKPDATPTKAAEPTAIVAPGDHAWNTLFGGECLEPFTNAWQDTFTVVDCTADHSAQLLARGTFDDESFPGEEKLATAAAKACVSSKVIDYPAASAYDNLVVSESYATTAEDWADGFTGYYCFASRTDGVLAGSIAVPATSAATAAP